MKFCNELKYERTFNLGNYESEKIGVGYSLDENECPVTVLKEMMDFVSNKGNKADTQMSFLPIKEEETKETKPAPKVEEPKKEEKKHEEPKKDDKKVAKKEPKKAIKKEPKEEPKKEVVAEKPKREVKPTIYNRALDLHKKIMAETLDLYFPSWKADAPKARRVSEKMEGRDFLDSEGRVLKSFTDELKVEMSA